MQALQGALFLKRPFGVLVLPTNDKKRNKCFVMDFAAIEDFFDCGKIARRKKNYELAYRMFLACEITFENGELPMYIPEYGEMAARAERLKWKMMKKLPEDVQRKLRREYAQAFYGLGTSKLFLCSWRDFCMQQYRHFEKFMEEEEAAEASAVGNEQ